MKDNYDFSEGKPNPYAKMFREDMMLSIDIDTINFFKEEEARTGLPFQKIMGLYLAHCAFNKKHLITSWEE